MSSFLGLHTSLTGIRAGQRGLDTASHNVANANTPGYTRQRVNLASRIPWHSEVGPIGTGVDVTGVVRMREAFLDTRVRTLGESFASADTTAALLQRAEDVLGEPENGVTTLLGHLFDSFDDLALRPADPAARMQVIASLDALTSRFQAVDKGWSQLSDDTEARIGLALNDINTKLNRLTEINATASSFGTADVPNDLLDERDLIVDELATALGATASVNSDGMIQVTVSGVSLVTAGPPPSNTQLSYDAASLSFSVAGAAVTVGGELGAISDFVAAGLPAIRADFDALAVTIRDALNARHAAGFDRNGNAGTALIDGTGAADLRRGAGITGPVTLAAAATAGAPHDGRTAQAIAAMREDVLDDSARSFAVSLGQRVANATSTADARESLYAGAIVSRQSAHSVSLDEEMVALVQFQRGLEASARVMTAVDQALDVLVNRTGIVGR